MVMSIACRYQKLLPAEALNAITLNAAVAIQCADRVGSIEVDKQADFVICDTLDYRAIAYEFGNPMIETVIIQGGVIWNASS
jgi:imidazolonepropionase